MHWKILAKATEGRAKEMDLEAYLNIRMDERNHNQLCVLLKRRIEKCKRKGHTEVSSILICHRKGLERKCWAWGGREHRNLDVSRVVGKMNIKRAALKKVFLCIFTCQCSS